MINYIVAIDLGTSCIKGIIGTRSLTGAFTVIACETESSAGCIRRGVIYNVADTTQRVTALIRKLAGKAPGIQIKKVYVGVGGQSVRSIDHVVTKSLGADGEVKKETTEALYEECRTFKPEGLDVLSIASPAFYLNGNREVDPIGIPCSRIEARYKLIVCRPSLKQRIYTIAERARIEIPGIFVSPLALADVALSETDKELGCALLDFGAGTASLTIFKNKQLAGLCTIPLGSRLITKDLACLHVVETEAERLKKAYGDAADDKENDSPVQVNSLNGAAPRQVKLSEINEVVKARLQEITENVYARLKESEVADKLNAGMIITGGGALLKNFDAAVRERFGMTVRYASVNKALFEKTNVPLEPEYGVVAGLLLKGTVNCSSYTPPPVSPPPVIKPEPPVEVEEPVIQKPVTEKPKEEGGTEKPPVIRPPRKPLGNRLINKVIGFTNDLFDDGSNDDQRNETEKKNTNNTTKPQE
ncbi:MAG: cell division protein FtsA [Tannerellaceae bacterium]|jgi:cell division protein FtsA|nr:cell division protein FtsA [Tannerellaceae bacterium]